MNPALMNIITSSIKKRMTCPKCKKEQTVSNILKSRNALCKYCGAELSLSKK